MSKPACESRPYEHKYQARQMLADLLSSPRLKQDDEVSLAYSTLIEYVLGVNHFETEEISESEKHYTRCLDLLISLPDNIISKYVNTFQDVLNALDILRSNRGENDAGMTYLTKASALYEAIKEVHKGDFSHVLQDYLTGFDNFHFIIEGGVNPRKAEQNYTLTLFYMAQAYSKLGNKHQSARFCAETMKRQMISGDYDMKDWAVNCINWLSTMWKISTLPKAFMYSSAPSASSLGKDANSGLASTCSLVGLTGPCLTSPSRWTAKLTRSRRLLTCRSWTCPCLWPSSGL